MKQQIEIDVPDGWEIDEVLPHKNIEAAGFFQVYLKKKDPEFIEVRDYLIDQHGEQIIMCHMKGHREVHETEKLTNFIKWLGNWRKVQI